MTARTGSNPVMEKLDLSLIRLLRSSSNMALRSGPFPKRAKIEMGAEIGVTPVDRAVKVAVSCTASSFYDDDDDPAVTLSCTYQVVYLWSADVVISVEDVERDHVAIHRESMSHAYPYLRHFIRTVSSEMGLPPLILPMFRQSNAEGLIGVIDGELVKLRTKPAVPAGKITSRRKRSKTK